MSDRRMLLQIVGAIQDAQEDNDNDDVSLLVAQFKDEIPNANVIFCYSGLAQVMIQKQF